MTYPSLSIVFFTEFAIIVVVKGWIAFYALLLTQLMVLAFGAINSSIHDLKKSESACNLYSNTDTYTQHINPYVY